jgi:formyl-CoA transferase
MLVPHFDEAIGKEVLGPGVMPVLTGTPGAVRWAGPPRPGTHNDEVYTGLLGLDATELDALRGAGVI